MKKVLKVLGYTLLVLVVLLVFAIQFRFGWRPFIGPRARPLTIRVFEPTPERLARGQYLVENVAGCTVCHSPHDWKKHNAPIPTGMNGAGEELPITDLPGRIVAGNLTPDPESGVGRWTDDELARAIREGVGRDGHALFPFMPYPHYSHLSDEDLASVIVYLRSLPLVRNPLPPTQIIFPVKYLIRGLPQPITSPVPAPDLSTPVKRGAYLVDIAACSDCHTPQVRGTPVPGMNFAGGMPIRGAWGQVASTNLTPDATGISYYDEPMFVLALRIGYVNARPLNQVMPCQAYKGMTDDDLTAIFAFLRTLPPVQHRVDNSEPPTDCRLCKMKHGLGSSN